MSPLLLRTILTGLSTTYGPRKDGQRRTGNVQPEPLRVSLNTVPPSRVPPSSAVLYRLPAASMVRPVVGEFPSLAPVKS